VETVPGAPSQIHIQISYRLLRTNAPQQVGVSMKGGWPSASNTTSS
jgi:hypothetical protein